MVSTSDGRASVWPAAERPDRHRPVFIVCLAVIGVALSTGLVGTLGAVDPSCSSDPDCGPSVTRFFVVEAVVGYGLALVGAAIAALIWVRMQRRDHAPRSRAVALSLIVVASAALGTGTMTVLPVLLGERCTTDAALPPSSGSAFDTIVGELLFLGGAALMIGGLALLRRSSVAVIPIWSAWTPPPRRPRWYEPALAVPIVRRVSAVLLVGGGLALCGFAVLHAATGPRPMQTCLHYSYASSRPEMFVYALPLFVVGVGIAAAGGWVWRHRGRASAR